MLNPDGHPPDEVPPARRQSPASPRVRGVAVVAGIVGIALLIWLVIWWNSSRHFERTNDAYLRADMVVISPKISGYVKEVLVHDNMSVRTGQVLLRIGSEAYDAAYDSAVAEVQQRRADLIRYQADLSRQVAVRAREIAQRGVAEASARFAAEDAGRFQRLATAGADSAQREAQAVSLREETAGRAIAAREEVNIASRELDSLRAQIGQGQAALAAAQAKVRSKQSDLEGADITAPATGQLGDRTVRIGQFVEPGSRLMTLIPDDSLYLQANFKETQLVRIRPGQTARVVIDALPGVTMPATVESLSPGTGSEFALIPPENATGNFTKIVQRVPVRLRLDVDAATRRLLRPGFSAEVEIDTSTVTNRR